MLLCTGWSKDVPGGDSLTCFSVQGGPKMYRVVRGDGRGLPGQQLDGGEEGYQLEDLEDEELQRLELERQSVIMPNSRRSPSVEVIIHVQPLVKLLGSGYTTKYLFTD